MNTTQFVRRWFAARRRAIGRYVDHAEELQTNALLRLVNKAKGTEWGHSRRFDLVKGYEDFAKTSQVNTYEELKADIRRMRCGEADVLWPGRVKWYAKSSGTTNDKSKFIPISRQNLYDTHYRGAEDTVALYLGNNLDSRMFSGKGLILGGSHAANYGTTGLVGDLSAVLIEKAGPFVEHYRIPSKRIALLPDFEEKRERIARLALKADVTNLSGVPSWMLSVLTRMMELSGKKYLREVWPNLEVFFHGGVAFTPYREQYVQLIDKADMHFMETYNASEGFFGLQDDPEDKALLLMIDYGVFYEFVPVDALGSADEAAVPLWGVETGKNYAVVISTSAGLWRYMIGDTVRFTQRNPYKFIITGRTKSFINAFGEELIVDNAENGIKYACEMTGALVKDYTAAPVYMDEKGQCRHQWVIEFSKKPDSIDAFARLLDKKLCSINSDYEAKRHKGITLQQLEVIVAKTGLFDEWLKSKGKLGGQHKVPRLNNSRHFIDELIAMNANHAGNQ